MNSEPISDTAYQQSIRNARKRVPRFLFRGVHRLSSGDPKCNTSNGIYSLAYFGEESSKGIHAFDEMPAPELMSLAKAHFGGSEVRHSPFSSWSGSLVTALKFAKPHADSLLFVLDTSKLDDEIAVACTWMAVDRPTKWEYLVFAPVTDRSSFCCASMGRIGSLLGSESWRAWCARSMSNNMALAIGQLFGDPAFTMAVAVAFKTLGDRRVKSLLISDLARGLVSLDWY